jgi:uncharacterized protein with NRDE domain
VCLALVALNAQPRLPLIVAANRDEFHARAAEPAHWWPEGILAGVDRLAGGTWFGVTAAGRWALVTNYREGVARDPKAPSRGELVRRALHDDAAPLECAAALALDGARYHGFSLLVGHVDFRPRAGVEGRAETSEPRREVRARAAYASNRASGAIALDSGIHGLSNHLLETPWPKVVRSKARLAQWAASDDNAIEPLFELLADRVQPEPAALPATGVAPEWERLLSSAFIVDARYGTRCSTLLTIAADGSVRFVERSFGPDGERTGEVAFEFRVTDPGLRAA